MNKSIRQTISLNGDCWQMGRTKSDNSLKDVIEWLPSKIPGEVRLDLLAHNMIEDPFYAKNYLKSQWVEDWNWCFKRNIDIDCSDKRIFLKFYGIDYHSLIFFNGEKISEHIGMFSPIILEVSKFWQNKNELLIHIKKANRYKDRHNTLKCQMSYGWDFSPPIKNMGIWDDVELIVTNEIFIKSICFTPRSSKKDSYILDTAIEVDSLIDFSGEFDFKISGANFECKSFTYSSIFEVKKGSNIFKIQIPFSEPYLWNVWERGFPYLYDIEVILKKFRQDIVIDKTNERIGLREVKMIHNDGHPDTEPWIFQLNGRRIFIRGINWTPCDSLFGRISKDKYEHLLKLAKEANINMFRVWGGGLREKKTFYELCDELGIMVWQEFPFACPLKPYPKNQIFRQLVEQEVTGIVKSLQNHPSVVLFCGGNEYSYSKNKSLINLMKKTCEDNDANRPFKVTSPTKEESHNWFVHHCFANLTEYTKDKTLFMSEFGMQSPPDIESLKKFIPKENLWPVAPSLPYIINDILPFPAQWEKYTKLLPTSATAENSSFWYFHNAQMKKIFRYASIFGFQDLESFVAAAQKAQAAGIKICVEHLRKQKFRTGGVMLWQLSDPWPNISWSIIDYYLTPKAGYYQLKEVFNPILVCLDFPIKKYVPKNRFKAKIIVINDLLKDFKNIRLKVDLQDEQNNIWKSYSTTMTINANSNIVVEKLDWLLPNTKEWNVKCEILDKNDIISSNHYAVHFFDPYPTPLIFKYSNKLMQELFWR